MSDKPRDDEKERRRIKRLVATVLADRERQHSEVQREVARIQRLIAERGK